MPIQARNPFTFHEIIFMSVLYAICDRRTSDTFCALMPEPAMGRSVKRARIISDAAGWERQAEKRAAPLRQEQDALDGAIILRYTKCIK